MTVAHVLPVGGCRLATTLPKKLQLVDTSRGAEMALEDLSPTDPSSNRLSVDAAPSPQLFQHNLFLQNQFVLSAARRALVRAMRLSET